MAGDVVLGQVDLFQSGKIVALNLPAYMGNLFQGILENEKYPQVLRPEHPFVDVIYLLHLAPKKLHHEC